MVERAEIIREKGTDRSRFYRGQVDKYTWVDIGSSFLPSELNAAYLLAQLEQRAAIAAARMARWEQYEAGLAPLEESLPTVSTMPICTTSSCAAWRSAPG